VAIGISPINDNAINDSRKIACINSKKEYNQFVNGSRVQSNEKLFRKVSIIKDSNGNLKVSEKIDLDLIINEKSEGFLKGTKVLGQWSESGQMFCANGSDITDILLNP
jgi:hypothetical protein